MNEHRAPSRGKIIVGFERLMRYVRWYINTSRFIPTEDKDALVKKADDVLQTLLDAERRAQGIVPLPPSIQKALTPAKNLQQQWKGVQL